MTYSATGNEGDVYNAIAHRDFEKLRTLLTQTPQLVESNPYGQPDEYSFLYLVAGKGDLEVARVFVDCGAQINREGPLPLFLTPLCGAAEGGHLDMVRYLLGIGASVDGTDLSAASPLMLAAREKHLEVVKCLLDAGSEVNRLGCVQRFLPVDFSGWHKSVEIEKLLRSRGGISVTDDYDWEHQKGFPILAHVSNNAGAVYPLAFMRSVRDQAFAFRLAEVRAKDKPLFLFSAGLYEFGQRIDIALALHTRWPLRQTYLDQPSKLSFPLDVLQRLAQLVSDGASMTEGTMFSRGDPRLSDLMWPDGVAALVVIDHIWPVDKKAAVPESTSSQSDDVKILTLAPVLDTAKPIRDEDAALQWAEKMRNASWAKITIPLTY
ncbi:MAG: ankyrin repeat domain-containing protein [Casimicrobium sp.]